MAILANKGFNMVAPSQNNNSFKINYTHLFPFSEDMKYESYFQKKVLNDENLNLIFKKIYEDNSHSDFFNDNNLLFLNSLDLGLYKFLEIAVNYNPHGVKKFLSSTNKKLFAHVPIKYSWLPKRTNFHCLIEYLEDVPPSIQKTFLNTFFKEFKHILYDDLVFLKNTFYHCSTDSFLYHLILKDKEFSQTNAMGALIFSLIHEIIEDNKFKDNFIANLNSLNFDALNKFKPHLEFSLAVIKNQFNLKNFPNRDILLSEVCSVFNNIILHNSLENNLDSNILKKDKKLKI